MKTKLFFGSLIILAAVAAAEEFTLPKSAKNKSVSASKTRENILETNGDCQKLVVQIVREAADLLAELQNSFEAGACGETESITGSSSKSKLSENLQIMQKVKQDLESLPQKVRDNKQKIKQISLKGS